MLDGRAFRPSVDFKGPLRGVFAGSRSAASIEREKEGRAPTGRPTAMLGPDSKKQMRAFGLVSTLGIGFWMAVAVGYYGGRWLDGFVAERFGWQTAPWLKWAGLVVGLLAAIREVVRGIRYVKAEMQKKPPDGAEPPAASPPGNPRPPSGLN